MDFDDEGRPNGMTVAVPPEIGKRVPDLLKQWESDPTCKQRFEELMAKKRESWRDRENRRKLVD